MASAPSPLAQRLISLKPGKSCVLRSLGPLITAKRYDPSVAFTTRSVDGQYVVTRTA